MTDSYAQRSPRKLPIGPLWETPAPRAISRSVKVVWPSTTTLAEGDMGDVQLPCDFLYHGEDLWLELLHQVLLGKPSEEHQTPLATMGGVVKSVRQVRISHESTGRGTDNI